jgi:arylsulfatase
VPSFIFHAIAQLMNKVHATTRNQEDAVKFLKERPQKVGDKPFFLLVAFFAPHSEDGNPEQYLPQNETFNVYKNLTLSPPYDMEASFKRLPPLFSERNEGRNRYRHRFDEPKKYDKMLKNYFRLITGVDTACRKVWEELEAQGILNETLFIFTTDNGYYHGEHGLAGKWYPHEESIRVPLVIWDPRMPESLHGTTDDSFTLNVDLAPTILGAAKLQPPKVMQGRDISDLYLRPDSPPWRQEFFYGKCIALKESGCLRANALTILTLFSCLCPQNIQSICTRKSSQPPQLWCARQ